MISVKNRTAEALVAVLAPNLLILTTETVAAVIAFPCAVITVILSFAIHRMNLALVNI